MCSCFKGAVSDLCTKYETPASNVPIMYYISYIYDFYGANLIPVLSTVIFEADSMYTPKLLRVVFDFEWCQTALDVCVERRTTWFLCWAQNILMFVWSAKQLERFLRPACEYTVIDINSCAFLFAIFEADSMYSKTPIVYDFERC